MRKTKVAAVSFLNTKPFLYGLENNTIIKDISLSLDTPSNCAKKLLSEEADIGLVPVSLIPCLSYYQILSDYCIGTDGAVKSVSLFSQCPINEINYIYLDYQSDASNWLLEILLNEYWHTTPHLIYGKKGFEQYIEGNVAGLVIGDRAIQLQRSFNHCYDLGYAWKKHTGLPFVFALWLCNKPVSKTFKTQFNKAIEFGIHNITAVITEQAVKDDSTSFDIQQYLTSNISYEIDERKKRGLKLFLEKLTPLANYSSDLVGSNISLQ